jgi:surfeit locus 1 family protein
MLGHWQLGRARQKEALYEAFERGGGPAVDLPPAPVDARYQHVRLKGRYVVDRQILLDNMSHDGVAGYRVLTPLEMDDGRWVLVDRGWIAPGERRAVLPTVPVAPMTRVVIGRLDEFPVPGLRLVAPTESGWPRRMSFPTQEAVSRLLGRSIYPRIVLLDAEATDGYVRDWHPGGIPPSRHYGYSVQWFALAATLLVLYALSQCRKQEINPR